MVDGIFIYIYSFPSKNSPKWIKKWNNENKSIPPPYQLKKFESAPSAKHSHICRIESAWSKYKTFYLKLFGCVLELPWSWRSAGSPPYVSGDTGFGVRNWVRSRPRRRFFSLILSCCSNSSIICSTTSIFWSSPRFISWSVGIRPRVVTYFFCWTLYW